MSEEKKNYYEILSVNEDADISEIKKAYRTLALKYHPDRNPDDNEAEIKIREITEAYSILSDPEKRDVYDKYGTVDENEINGGNNEDINEMLRRMGINVNGMGKRGDDNTQEKVIPITIEEIYNGAEKNIEIDVNKKCDCCDGFGTNDKIDYCCKTCNGSGIEVILVRPNQMIPMMQQVQQRCSTCHGKGEKINNNNKCNNCNGKGTVSDKITKNIKINKNFDYETKMRLKKLGNYNKNTKKNCDIIMSFTLIFPENSDITLANNQGFDLLLQKEINLKDALCGFTMYFKHLDGNKYKIKFNEVIEDGDVKIIFNKGLPNSTSDTKLLIKFGYKYPEKILNIEEYNEYINKKDDLDTDENIKELIAIDIEEYQKNMEQERMNQQQNENVNVNGCPIS
jgi:DnaJ-class molecular chaperone